jgi:hypothetical protein
MRNLSQWEPFREERGPSEAWGVRDAATKKVIVAATHRLDGEDASVMARTHNQRLVAPAEIMIESVVSHRTHLPVLQFTFGDATWEQDYRTARDLIDNIYRALEAGLTDAFLVKWVREVLAPTRPPEEVASMLGHLLGKFREFRRLVDEPITVEGSAPS